MYLIPSELHNVRFYYGFSYGYSKFIFTFNI